MSQACGSKASVQEAQKRGHAYVGLLMADSSGENPRFVNNPDVFERRLIQHVRQSMTGGARAQRCAPRAKTSCMM
jgi:hypothetical protein